MTKETKDLFEYCRAAVRIATKDVNSGLNHFQTSEEKVIKQIDELENKLKEMEVYLTKGGIILDRNGKQCHAGDRVVRYHSSPDERYHGEFKFSTKLKQPHIHIYRGKLEFSTEHNQLYIHTDDDGVFNPIPENFELIEE